MTKQEIRRNSCGLNLQLVSQQNKNIGAWRKNQYLRLLLEKEKENENEKLIV